MELNEQCIIDAINELEKENKFKKVNKKEDKLYDVALIMKQLRDNGLITDYPHIDKIHRVYYLYEKIIMKRRQLLPLETQQSCYDYFQEVTDGYNGNALTIDHSISYDEFKKSIEEEAVINNEIGISSDDRVTFLLPSIPETYSNFYALSKINAGRNIVDLRTSLEGIKKYINETESEYLFCMETLSPNDVKEILNTTSVKKVRLFTPPFYTIKSPITRGIGKGLIWAREFGFKKIGESVFIPSNYEEILNCDYRLVKATTYDSSKPTLFMHTSGTSGFPKTIMSNDEAINIVANQYRQSLMDLGPEYRSLAIMPPWIFYGIMGFHMPFALNMNVYPIADPVKTKFDDIILDIKPNTIAGVPNHWISLMNSKKVSKDFSLDFLKTPACGGDGISKTNNDKMNEFFREHHSSMDLGPGYALSENTSVATANQDVYNESGTVGFNFIDMNCAIVDPETLKPLKYNETGIVCINGDLMLGYLNNPQATKDAFIEIDGVKYVYTGDIGYMNERGFLTIVGRQKNIIVRNDGFKISPLEIENVILQHDAVKNCVVFGIKDTNYEQGSLPAVRIEFKNENLKEKDKEKIISEIKKICKKELSSYYIPVAYYCDKIPYTSMSKIDISKIQEEFISEEKEESKQKTKIYR